MQNVFEHNEKKQIQLNNAMFNFTKIFIERIEKVVDNMVCLSILHSEAVNDGHVRL